MNKLPRLLAILAFVLLLFVSTFHFLESAQAADFTVTNTDDSGAGSLRAAIDNAIQAAGVDTITFDPSLDGQTITLSSGPLVITTELAIDASALTDSIRLSGNDISRVFFIESGGVVTLTHLEIADGATLTGSGSCRDLCGGGIYAEPGAQLTLEEGLVINNFANSGGGIHSDGLALIRDSLIISNQAQYDGGGIRTSEAMTIRNSAILSNTSGGVGGGGLYAEFLPSLHLISSTVAYNDATGNGGGIYNKYPLSFVVENSTIAHNTASDNGGGVVVESDWSSEVGFQMSNSTLSGNEAASNGGGLYVTAATTSTVSLTLTNNTLSGNSSGVHFVADGTSMISHTIRNSIIANSTGANCVNATGNAYNLADDDSCQGFRQGNARLASLADNGGPTLTHLPLPGSPAMGEGDVAVCQAAPINGLDQRGIARAPTACDIGSTEVEDIALIYLPLVRRD